MASFSEFLGSLDADAGKRGKQFEYFVKWFLKNDPEWSTQVDQVWLWDEYPNSWGRDCGIDLVFRHKNGESWAVQAKCYAPTTSITKADVDSFISESNRDGINKRLLIATTDLIGANAKQVCDAQDKSVTRFMLSHFEDAEIEYPSTLDDLPKAKRKEKPKPRDHQIEAIEAVASNFKDVDRGQLIMACGTGKTFTTLWIKEKLGVESTLVLLPSLGLLSQTLHEWTLAANEEFQVLCVCSDESVGKKGSDEAVHSIADLAFPVTSNAGEIRSFLNGSGKKVIFSTYQSSPLISEAQIDKAVPAFDLAIADEAHRCAGKVSGDFSTILDGEKIRAKKRLFTTATPRTYSSSVKKAAEDRGVEVVGMDDESVFGRQLFTLNFGEAIKRGLLTDYRVVIIGVDDPTISEWIENRELLKADSDIEMDAESLAAQVGLLKAIRDYDLKRLISFHSRVSRAEVFSQSIHKVLGWLDEKHKPSGDIKADFVSGEMPADKRRRKLSQLRNLGDNQRGLLANARCLSEGVDVPSLDGIAFIDPRSSQIDIIQAVGRAIRLSANKQAGTIILPVIIGNSEDSEEVLEKGSYKPIWDVLNALKAHDDVLADELSEIRMDLGRKGGGIFTANFSKIFIDLPAGVDKTFGDGLRTLLVERSTNNWDFWYGLLEKYVKENSSSRVPRRFSTENGYRLGAWIGEQKKDFKAKTLFYDRVKKLELFEDWVWDNWDEQWDIAYKALVEYQKDHQHTLVPHRHQLDDGFKLGQWVAVQRRKKDELSPEKVARLNSIEGWVWGVLDERWERGFSELSVYAFNQGNCIVPFDYSSESGFKLGSWVLNQRNLENKIDPDRKKRLEGLPKWIWNTHDEIWIEKIKRLREYVAIHGDALVPQNYLTSDGFKLGYAVGMFRQRRERLPKYQVEQLESLKGWCWDKYDAQWNSSFDELLRFFNANGTALVPSKYVAPNGFHLGRWTTTQRKNKDQLTQDRVERLESLKGWLWNTTIDYWEIGYEKLLDFSRANGDASPPFKFKSADGFGLGNWVHKQRKGRISLSSEQIHKLESLPKWKWGKEK